MSALSPRNTLIGLTILCLILTGRCAALSGPERILKAPPGGTAVVFPEIWAYLMQGEEKHFRGDEPVSDLCYFSARVNHDGTLTGPRVPPAHLKKNRRLHLVVAEISNHALTRLILDPALPLRKNLVEGILSHSEHYSGVQIDFEAVAAADRENFISFLRELKRILGDTKTLSVALPARRGPANDAYQYASISEVVDRIIIMAYDQHWSTGPPGPVASLPWCREVVNFAKTRIPSAKLIMGIPLYGRAWQETNHSRALRDEHVREILKARKPRLEIHPEKGPSMTYTETVTIRAYFNTLTSILERMRLYEAQGAGGIAFWRIGQGDPRLWKLMSVSSSSDSSSQAGAESNPGEKKGDTLQ